MGVKKIQSLVKNTLFCLNFSWNASPLYTFLRTVSSTIPSILTVLLSYIGKYILDTLSGDNSYGGKYTFILLLGAMLLTNILIASSQKIVQYVQAVHTDILNFKLSQYIMQRSLNIDLEYFDNPEYHNTLVFATKNIRAVTEIIWYVMQAIATLITSTIVLIMLCSQNWGYGLLTLVCSVPAALASIRYTKSIYSLEAKQIINDRAKTYIQGISSDKAYALNLRLYKAATTLVERCQKLWESNFIQKKKVLRLSSIVTGVLNCLPEVIIVVVGLDIGLNVFKGRMTVGSYSLYTGLVTQLWGNISTLINSLVLIYDNQLKIESVQKLRTFENHIEDNGHNVLKSVKTIEFRNVNFSYPGTNVMVLNRLNFRIEQGEHVALVGVNGSGKSTIIKLLLRFYEPDSGQIFINEKDIRDYSIDSLRSNFSVYFQDEPNYCFSLRDNIKISDLDQNEPPDAVDRKMYGLLMEFAPEIVQKAYSIDGLSTQLMRTLSQDGMELSGGQHQKVALVRAFFRRHTSLILDEPSASLDPEAEYKLFKLIAENAQGITTLFTSHRLSNTRLASRILVIEYGSVIENGTHDALISTDSRYKQLLEYQNIDAFIEKS